MSPKKTNAHTIEPDILNDLVLPDPSPEVKKERARLRALRSFDVLDSPPEEAFDALTRLASYICQSPISLISLIDSQRQWFKSRLGLDVTETRREDSICQYAIRQTEVFEIEDASRNEIFKNLPAVIGDPSIRFYAGAPLTTSDGHNLGTLCILDTVPRTLTAEQKDALQTLAREVVSHLELRRARLRLKEEREKLEELLRMANSASPQATLVSKNDVFVKQDSKLQKIAAADILWIEALGDYVNIHTAKDRFTVNTTMKEMEARLSAQDFARVHRKFIVRLDHLKAIEGDSALIEKAGKAQSEYFVNGMMYIPIGNSYKNAFLQRLNLV